MMAQIRIVEVEKPSIARLQQPNKLGNGSVNMSSWQQICRHSNRTAESGVVSGKGQCSIDTNIAAASWWMERNLIPPTIKAAATSGMRYERESHRECPRLHQEECSLPSTPPLDCPSWWCCTTTNSPALPPMRHNHQQVPSQSVQTPNVNSSSLNYMFKVVAVIFQQIMTQLNGAEPEEDRVVAITKTVLQLVKQNDC
jgi:hypothetical protein